MSEYFSHDYDAREDEKIQELLFELEMEGYGIYWSIIEMLYKNDGYMQINCERIAYALHTDEDKIKRIINDFDLFKVNGNAFTSASVLHRLKLRKGKTITAKKAAKVRWDKARAKYADAMQTQSNSNAKKESKVKERNESKENNTLHAQMRAEFKNDNVNRIELREEIFKSDVSNFKNYPSQMLKDFILYWSEPNKSNTKMRFELEKTWDLKRRLERWAANTTIKKAPESIAPKKSSNVDRILNEDYNDPKYGHLPN